MQKQIHPPTWNAKYSVLLLVKDVLKIVQNLKTRDSPSAGS